MLSPKLLEALRQYWCSLKHKPKDWLFPGGGRAHNNLQQPMTDKVVWHAVHQAAQRAGIEKLVHPHTLRHYVPSRIMSGAARWRAVIRPV